MNFNLNYMVMKISDAIYYQVWKKILNTVEYILYLYLQKSMTLWQETAILIKCVLLQQSSPVQFHFAYSTLMTEEDHQSDWTHKRLEAHWNLLGRTSQNSGTVTKGTCLLLDIPEISGYITRGLIYCMIYLKLGHKWILTVLLKYGRPVAKMQPINPPGDPRSYHRWSVWRPMNSLGFAEKVLE